MNLIGKYALLVKFSHTVFALPFALLGFVWAVAAAGCDGVGTTGVTWITGATSVAGGAEGPLWLLLLKILVCMVTARNAAMGFNRWADRRFDAENPRTAGREIPAGVIKPGAALTFVIINAVLFVVVAGFINRLALALSPVALAVILGYSFTKRFTSWSHLVLGAALAIAPAGAWIAVLGRLSATPLLMSALVATWVAGFDILYSLQDADHDRRVGLHSVPAHFSPRTAVGIGVGLHVITLTLMATLGVWSVKGGEWRVESGLDLIGSAGGGATFGCPLLYWIGAGLFAAMVVVQHLIFSPSQTGRIARLFTLLNGASSIVFALFAIAALVL